MGSGNHAPRKSQHSIQPSSLDTWPAHGQAWSGFVVAVGAAQRSVLQQLVSICVVLVWCDVVIAGYDYTMYAPARTVLSKSVHKVDTHTKCECGVAIAGYDYTMYAPTRTFLSKSVHEVDTHTKCECGVMWQ